MDNTAPDASTETMEIVGLPGGPVVVNSSYEVVKADAPPADQGEAAAASPAPADQAKPTAAENPAAGAPDPDPVDEDEEAEEPDPDELIRQAQEEEEDGGADGVQPDDEGKSDEEQQDGEDKTDGEEKPEGEEKAAETAEPSEADALVEQLGGVDVLKLVQPLIEASLNADATPDDRLNAIKEFLPERQFSEVQTALFWNELGNPASVQILVTDKEAQAIFSEKVLGVPFAFVAKIIEEQKELYTAEEIAAFGETDGDGDEGEPAEKKPAAQKEEKPDEKKPDEKKPDGPVIAESFRPVLDAVNDAVGAVVTSQKIPDDKLQDFDAAFAEEFGKDARAVAAYKTAQKLAEDGGERQAKALLASASKRVAAVAAARVLASPQAKPAAGAAPAPKSEKVKTKAPAAKPAAAEGGGAETPIAAVAARFPGGIIPDPDSPEFARFLAEDVERRMAGG